MAWLPDPPKFPGEPRTLGAYALEVGISGREYLAWHEDLCPSCYRAYDDRFCHLCNAAVRPKSWEDMGLEPPAWDPLVGAVEQVAARVVRERFLELLDLALVIRTEGLTEDEGNVLEHLVRQHMAGTSIEVRRRFDEAQKERKNA